MSVIATPVTDILPINGYLYYPQSIAFRFINLTTVDNSRAEDERSYSVNLVSGLGGADVDDSSKSKALLTGNSELKNFLCPKGILNAHF